jgi:hypothetical protein
MSCGPTAGWGGKRPLWFVFLFIAFHFVCPLERRWSHRKPDQSLPRHLDADTQPRLSSIARSPESLERTRHFDSRFKRPLLASRFRSRGGEISSKQSPTEPSQTQLISGQSIALQAVQPADLAASGGWRPAYRIAPETSSPLTVSWTATRIKRAIANP